MTATATAPPPALSPDQDGPPPLVEPRQRFPKWIQVLVILGLWIVCWKLFFGKSFINPDTITGAINWLQKAYDNISNAQMSNPLFVDVLNPLARELTALLNQMETIVSNLGWTGVIGIACAISFLVAGVRYAILTLICFSTFGLLGLWDESMQTLVIVLVAVIISLIIGIPLGIWAGLSRRFNAFITPVLDLMQIMPSFAYLPIIVLFFLIGPAAGTIATIIYAVPPAIRLTAAGIRGVNPTLIEASSSLGSTGRQRMRSVQLPQAKGTIIVGVNQTTMAALSMATIAALIATPGLGQVVIQAFETEDVGAAFNASLALVFMGIAFDRVTSAASRQTELRERSGNAMSRRTRIIRYVIALALIVLGIILPAVLPDLAKFPASWSVQQPIHDWVNTATDYAQLHWYTVTNWFQTEVTVRIINPLQSLLLRSPVIVTLAALSAISFVLGRTRAAVTAALCLLGVLLLGVWTPGMVTLGSVIVGAIVAIALGVVVGVWMGRSRAVDTVLRPILDAAQVMPPFVYLVPFLGLFGPNRFTGIIAAVVYAAPVAIKIVAEGIRGVPANSVESAISAGSSTWQTITKVQLPMSRNMVMLALNQGVIFVLAMVVVSGLVGGGGLGYAVITGFTQNGSQGLGLAAGLAIVLLGVMLDRVTQAAGRGNRHRIESL
jgi:glycine betaine/proline transport system permease protein